FRCCATSRLRPSPPFTPLPYTTLFRSEAHTLVVNGARPVPAKIADQQRPVRQDLLDHKTNLIHMCRKHDAFLIRAVHSFFQNDQDRKSTRLNSSHVSISYAVFCLKKKI